MAETKKFCIHSDGLGYCDILSDGETHHYCVEGPCPHEKIVEYAPVKHGRWELIEYQSIPLDTEQALVCTNCGFAHQHDAWFNRCPNCGAKMDLEG